MALIKCRECGNTVSTEAKTCPKCGIKNPTKKELSWPVAFIIFTVVIIIISSLFGEDNTQPETPKTPEQIRSDQILKGFSAWDGTHIELEKIIKKSMNDRASYEHVKTVYYDMDDHLIVKTQFRGKNIFGGMVINEVTAKADLNGNVLEIISQSP